MIKICEHCKTSFSIAPSRANKRFTCSKDCGNKMKTGRSFSEEHKKKISEGEKKHLPRTAFQLGHIGWNIGLKYSPEQKAKLDMSGLYTHGERKGTKHTEETKNKISIAKKLNPCRHWLGKKRPELSGENHFNWKGGISTKDRLERVRFSQVFRKEVLKRDDYTCQICNKRGGSLQVDHIKSWFDNPELRFDINNCRTLCMNCHYKITFGREKPNNVSVWGHNLIQKERILLFQS